MACISGRSAVACFFLSTIALSAAERKLPEAAKVILDKSDRVTAYGLEPAISKDGSKETLHDWIVRSKIEIKNAATGKMLIEGIVTLIDNPDKEGARCFRPRHAIRAIQAGKGVDLVICFECGWVDIFVDGNAEVTRIAMDSPNFEFLDVMKQFTAVLPKLAATRNGRILLEKELHRENAAAETVGEIDCMHCSADGTELLIASESAVPMGGIEIYDTRDWTLKRRFGVRSGHAFFTADGKRILSARKKYLPTDDHDFGVKVLDARSGELLAKLDVSTDFKFSPKLNLIAFSSTPRPGPPFLYLYDLAKGEQREVGSFGKNIRGEIKAFSDSGIVTSSSKVWFPPYDKIPIQTPWKYSSHAKVSPTGLIAAVSLNEKTIVEIWDISTLTRIRQLDKHSAEDGRVSDVAFSRDGAFLASLSESNSLDEPEVIVWETAEFKEVDRVAIDNNDFPIPAANQVVFLADSKRFATGGGLRDAVKIWRIQDQPAK